MVQTGISYRIEWRPKARDDLRAIIRHIATGESDIEANDLACVLGQALHSRIRQLAQCPELGRVGRPGLPGDIRELMFQDDWVVFYRMPARAGVLEILRIKPNARHAP